MLHNNRLFAVAAILGLLIATVLGSGPGMAQAAPGAPAPAATTPVAPAAGCGMNFADVPAASWFYPFVEYLYCSHAVSGYGSEFRPNATTTRAQLTKMIGNALGWPLTYSGAPHFADVPPAQPFYQTIEAAYAHGIISGYQCGGPGEPCPGTYFRPGADVTRAQLAKMIILAQGWDAAHPPQPRLSDVPPGAWYAGYVEAANLQGVVSGYADGTFRPFASATRAQLAKMIYNTLTPPAFDQGDDESEIQPQDDVSEETPEDLDPGPDGGPGLALPGEAGKAPSAPATATISGTITSTNTGSPLVGARVVAHPVGGGADVETTTGAAGAYTLAVPAGSYNVVAAAPEQMYPVTLAPGGPVTLADGGGATVSFALTQGGVLAGTITDSTTHAPIQGADEWAVPVALPPRAYGGTLSDGQGRYRLVVPAGPVGAWAAKPSDTYPRTPPSGGNPIAVTAGMTTTVDFALAQGGVIAGHITDAATQAPLAGSRVWARHDPLAVAFGAPLTDATGYYRIVVPGGSTYNVHALNVPGMYPRGDYGDNPVTVSTGMTVTADIQLAQGGMISGVITGADTGLPLAGARAVAHAPVEQRYWSWWSDAQGHYRVIVPAGSWNLYGRSDWQGYYRTPAAANPISVTTGSNVTMNLALERGAIIKGTVTDAASHAPLAFSRVWANPPGPGGPNYGVALTDGAGRYLLAVPAGTWGVYARNDRLGYPRTPYAGNPLTTTVGATYTADISMTLGTRIHGVLTDAGSGQPIAGAAVWSRGIGGGLGYGGPRTDAQGRYVISVPAGTWRLFARDLPGLYPRTAYPGNPVVATAGADITADWTLTQGGQITGHITDAATGNPLPQAMVWAREVGGLTRDADFLLEPDGTYRLVVPAGDYRLRAADVREGYPSLAFPGNPVHVTPGGTTPASWALQRW
jgi:hypothetical protein